MPVPIKAVLQSAYKAPSRVPTYPPCSRAPAPDGDLNRASTARGSSSNLPSLEGQPKKKKKSKLAAGGAAAAPAAGAAIGGGDAEDISQSSDATPPGAGKAGAAGPAATSFTNPLTTADAAGGSGAKPGSGEKAGGSARKPPLALQRSTGELAHCLVDPSMCVPGWAGSTENCGCA